MRGEDGRKTAASIAITLVIVLMLIFSQPTTALFLNIQPSKTSYNTGETITLTAVIKIDEKELLPVQEVRLIVEKDGVEYENVSLPVEAVSKTVAGSKLNFDVAVSWNNVSYKYGYGYAYYGGQSYNFGYGYGYGYSGLGIATISYTVKFSLTETGNYNAKLVVKADGKTFESSKASFKVSAPAAAPAPAVGVGGGYVITPPEELVQTFVISLPANVEKEIELPKDFAEKIGILRLTIKLPEEMKLELKVEALEKLPFGTPEPPAAVYKFFEITFRKYGTDIEVEPSGYVEFKVTKDWVEKAGYKPEEIVLMKYDGKWIELKTELTGEDESSYYYKAELKSFSLFAIAAKRVAPAPTPTPVHTPAPTVTPVTTPTPAVKATPTPTPEKVPPAKPWWQQPQNVALIIVILLVVIAVVAYAAKRKG